MLGKLIKYDLKFVLKTIGIYAIILFCCAILFNLTSYDTTCQLIDDAPVCYDAPIFLQIAHTVFWNAIFAAIIGLILSTIVRTWARFKISLFNDEAYLTHTLPISRQALWSSKFLSAVIIALIVMTCIGINFGILALTPSGQNLIRSFGINEPRVKPIFYVIYALTVLTQYLYATMCGFAGIIINNKSSNHRNIRAIICGFAVYLLGIFIMLGCFLIWSTFDGGIHAMIFSGAASQTVSALTGEGYIEKALVGIGIIYIVLITILYFVNRKLISDGVNLD